MAGRLLQVTGTVLVIAAAFVTPVLATSTPASADTVFGTCTIVANPTSTNFTDCPGEDLATADFAGVNLSYANLAGASLVGDDLSGANLSSANLSGATFVDSGFCRNSTCSAADLSGATLTDANLSGDEFIGSGLLICFGIFPPCPLLPVSGAVNLSDAVLTGTLLVPQDQTVFAPANGAVVTWDTPPSLPGATPGTCAPPSGSTFPLGFTTVTCQVLDDHGNAAVGTFFVRAEQVQTFIDLSSSAPSSVKVGAPVTYTASLGHFAGPSQQPSGGTVTFTDDGSPIVRCSAVPLGTSSSASCSTTFQSAGAHIIAATYSGSGIFAGSSSLVPFTEVVMPTPCKTLAGCNLSGLRFTDANLASADLHGANLMRANMSGADLSNANLQGANLMGANLRGANLSGANVNVNTNFNRVTWGNTSCPDYTNSDSDGGTCVGHT